MPLGVVTDRMETWIKKTDIDCPMELLRKGIILEMTGVIRKVMYTSEENFIINNASDLTCYTCINYMILRSHLRKY